MITSSVLFLVVLFLIKNTSVFENTVRFVQGKNANGLAYDSSATVAELVSKDTDLDGVPDWQEPLFGLDPNKKETTPGIPDSTAVAKMRIEQELSSISGVENKSEENLTETDKFARELFSTSSTLSQNGAMDQATADKMGSSLADKIKNQVVRKVYTLSDITVIKDDTSKAAKKYYDTLASIYKKYPVKGNVTDVLKRFIIDENNIDVTVLAELDPIIEQQTNVLKSIIKMDVSPSFAQAHLDMINALERLLENISDIKLFDTDPIVTMGAVSKFEENTSLLQSAVKKLSVLVEQKLNN